MTQDYGHYMAYPFRSLPMGNAGFISSTVSFTVIPLNEARLLNLPRDAPGDQVESLVRLDGQGCLF